MTIIEIPAKIPEQKVIRVAAYARVSVDGDLTFHSLEAQRDYYKNKTIEGTLAFFFSAKLLSITTIG